MTAEEAAEERLGRWKTATCIVVALVFWIAMAEVDRLIGGFILSGETNKIADVVGIGAWDNRDSWVTWSGLDLDDSRRLPALIFLHLALDLAFAASYVWLLWRLVWPHRKLAALAGLVGLFEVLEAVFLGFGAWAVLNHQAAWVGIPLSVIALCKWGFLLVFLLCCLAVPSVRTRILSCVSRIARTLQFQRLSASVVAIIAVLALLPIPGVNDQMPDSQRLWAVEGLLSPSWWSACFLVAIMAAGLFVLGRRRSDLAWQLWSLGQAPAGAPSYAWWFFGPATVLIGGGCAIALNGHVDWQQMAWFCVPPMVLVVISQCLVPTAPRVVNRDPTRAVDIWIGGDNLAVALVVVSGLAAVRSFTAPVANHLIHPSGTSIGWAATFLTVGAVLACASYRLKAFWVRRIIAQAGPGPRLNPNAGSPDVFRRWLLALFVFAVLFLAALAIVPGPVTAVIGVSAAALGGVGSWALAIGYLIVRAQDRRPIEILQRMGFTANPVLSLLVIVLVFGQINGGNGQVHAPRQSLGEPLNLARDSIEERFDEWLVGSALCDRDFGIAGKQVRPMLIVASEGGGIRAASWTARVFAEIVKADSGCGPVASFASSGVSGGSLGLTLVNLYDSSAAEMVEAVDAVSDPDALAVGVAGAVVGDLVAEGAGVMLPTDQGAGLQWHDRAGLMETMWQSKAKKLGDAFDVSEPGPAGSLILNSTATGSGCRLVVSQLDLVTATADPRKPGCREPEGQPVTIDLLESGQFCNAQLNWSTAVGLSARFPVISPAGRVFYPVDDETGQSAHCPSDVTSAPSLQAIDGGYAEVSGLGTVVDLWWELGTLVARHNRNVEAAEPQLEEPASDADKAKSSFVVPIFVFIRNSPGSDVAPAIPKPAAEILVPLAGIKAKDAQSDASAWKQRLQSGASVCALESSTCSKAASALAGALGSNRVVEVAPNSEPAIDPPLGWTLSAFSIERLNTAMGAETAPCGIVGKGCSDFRKLLDLLAR